MPPRRSHKKSRAGCGRCKTRKIKVCAYTFGENGSRQTLIRMTREVPRVMKNCPLTDGSYTSTVKCDEIHPVCGGCVKHGVRCDFAFAGRPTSVAAADTKLENITTTISSTASCSTADATDIALPAINRVSAAGPMSLKTILAPQPAVDAYPGAETPPILSPHVQSPFLSSAKPLQTIVLSPAPSRLMELRLMHQYTTSTCRTLTVHAPSAVATWQEAVPRIAFEVGGHGRGTYLADAVLAVAALHLRTIYPHDGELAQASHSYMASSLSQYRAALEGEIDDFNAEALFLTATLISFQSTASRIFVAEDQDHDAGTKMRDGRKKSGVASPRHDKPNRPYTLPISWFHSFQGVKTLVATSWLQLRNSEAVKAVISSQPVLRLDLDAADPSHEASFFGHLWEGIEDELAGEERELDATPSVTRQAYQHAIAVLNWVHKSPYRTAALAFPATVTKRFVSLVEMHRPRALAVLACFFALLKRLEGVWWLHNVVRREVMGIVSLFHCNSPWLSHLEWPIRVAMWESDVVPADVWGSDYSAEERRPHSHDGDQPVSEDINAGGANPQTATTFFSAGMPGVLDVDDVGPSESVLSHIEIFARNQSGNLEKATSSLRRA